jgi:hypothetical protein
LKGESWYFFPQVKADLKAADGHEKSSLRKPAGYSISVYFSEEAVGTVAQSARKQLAAFHIIR